MKKNTNNTNIEIKITQLNNSEKNVSLVKPKTGKIKNKLIQIVKIIFIISLTFVILLPLYKMFIDSINYHQTNDYFLFPNGITLNNYIKVIGQLIEEDLLINSLTLATICSLIQVMFSAIMGYSFAKLCNKSVLGNIIFWAYMLTLLIPHENMRIAYRYLFLEHPLFGINLFGNKYSIYILYLFGMGIKSPIFVYLFRNYFKNINEEIFEQSRLDGCGNIKSFFHIALPLSMPAIIPTFFLSFVWIYNDSYFVDFFEMSYVDFNVISRNLIRGRMRGGATPTGFIMLIPILILFIIVERRILDCKALDYS